MDRENRLRRVGLLCCHFARNCAYYKASWNGTKTKATNEYWLTVQGNFIDISVLEWFKLFCDHNDKHHWKKITEKPDLFKDGMLKHCTISEDDLVNCRKSFKTYRDKFIAHLDSEDLMHIPMLDTALEVTKYYYSYVAKELGTSKLQNLPQELESYYQKCFSDSAGAYEVEEDRSTKHMKRISDSQITRIERTMLRAAKDFCAADADVQRARCQWRELHLLHDPYDGVCCLPWESPYPEESRVKQRSALPRSKWCKDCKRIEAEAVDYQAALLQRRSAKTRMKRAYKKFVDS